MNPAIAMAMGGGGSVTPTYSDDVFATYTYTGTGASQSINVGIDLSGKGGLFWAKYRSGTPGSTSHNLWDTDRGTSAFLATDSTGAQSSTAIASFNSTGVTLASGSANTNTVTYSGWFFRKAAKFFDVVSYTGNGVNGRTLTHNLGQAPGLIIVKANTSAGLDWFIWHKESSLLAGTSGSTFCSFAFDNAAANKNELSLMNSLPTSTSITLPGGGASNTNTTSYVMYLFGHDTATTGLIQCGKFTCDGSGNASVTSLGWEPQFLFVKASSTTGEWIMLDTTRVWNLGSADTKLLANTTGAETTATDHGEPTATGFNFKGGTASATYIYMAIRRSNKPPTTGTQVFNAATRTGTGATAVSASSGFPVDLFMTKKRSSTTLTAFKWFDRLRGKTLHIDSSSNAVEATTSDSVTAMDSMDGVTFGADTSVSAFNTSGHTYVDYFLKRAVGVFDIVHYIGTAAAQTVSHNLNAVPELMIVKPRDAVINWYAYHKTPTATQWALVSGTGGFAVASTIWNNTTPTNSVFSVGTALSQSSVKYIAYLFATLAGVSKVGSYVGNGTSLNIDCGFASGARFVMIKRSDNTGDWIVFDTVRGIVAGNDPWLAWNTNTAEVTTDDSIDPYSLGFTVNQVAATNVNVSSGNYIYLAIA